MIKLKFKDIHSNPYVLSELILTAKIMRKKNFKIQMLAGNTLKIGVGASFEISTTLVAQLLQINILKKILYSAPPPFKNISKNIEANNACIFT